MIKKGYTIEVTSWENDGDNYKTKSIVEQSKEKAKAIKEMCDTIFKSQSNGAGGIGNCGDIDSHRELIVDFMKDHPVLSDHIPNPTDEQLMDVCMELNYDLMGGSEWYGSRVCESCKVTFSEVDVETKEVTFD